MLKEANGGAKVRNGIIYIYGTIDGKRYRLSTKQPATRANLKYFSKNYYSVLLELIQEQKEARKMPCDVGEFVIFCLKMSETKRAKTTQKEYLSQVKRLIIPFFRGFKLDDIRPIDVERWQVALSKKGYSSQTIKRLRIILNYALNKAVANELITKNPMNKADKVEVVHKKTKPYNPSEIKAILSGASGWLRIFLLIAFGTGMRPSEIIGLKVDDLDFDNRTINLSRAIVCAEIKSGGSIKNHDRLVIMPDFLLNELKEYVASINREWLFVNYKDKPFFSAGSVTVKHFKPLLKSVGVEYRGLYPLRHSFVSLLRNAGVGADFVSELAGHSIEISDKHYYTPNISKAKVNAVNNVFGDFFDSKNQKKSNGS